MAPHLMRAQGAYKADKHATPTHAHTTNTLTHPHPHPPHTHTPQKHKHSSHGFDGNRREKERNQNAEEKRWVFSFDLKEESDVACLTEKEREFQLTGPMY